MEPQPHPPECDRPILLDGELVFAVRRADGTEEECRLDLLCVKLCCERCEDKHRLEKDEAGCYRPTPEFLIDLAGQLTALGMARCTPTLAFKLWVICAEQMERLKKTENGTQS